MSALTLEERVAALETKLDQLQRTEEPDQTLPWWEQIRGQFKNDPDYDEAMRLGREYRESLRPENDEGS